MKSGCRWLVSAVVRRGGDRVETDDAWRADSPDVYTCPACLLGGPLGQTVRLCVFGALGRLIQFGPRPLL